MSDLAFVTMSATTGEVQWCRIAGTECPELVGHHGPDVLDLFASDGWEPRAVTPITAEGTTTASNVLLTRPQT